MRTLVESQGVGQHQGTGTVLERSGRIALIASISIVAVAGIYILALYLLAQ